MDKKRQELLKKIILISFFTFTAPIYLISITRDIYSGDLGDLVTAANVFGVAHPPGYPLLTLSGFILSFLPLSIPPVSKVALVSVISSLAALFFFYKFSLKETKNFFISLLSTSILAFSYIFWLFTEIPEVFALNNFFIIALFYFAREFYEKRKEKSLYILSFLAGLSLTNQHQIILIYPAILILLLPAVKIYFKKKKEITKAFFALVLGLLPYLYIPIAASRNPVVNWNNASNLQNFIHLVLRQDYVTFAKGDLRLSERLPIIGIYLSSLLNNYSTLIVLICILGIFMLFKINKFKFISFLLAFFISGPFFIYYIVPVINNVDTLGVIERLYTQSFLIFILFLPYGFLSIHNLIKRLLPRKINPAIFLLIFLIVPAQMFFYNFEKNNLSKTNIGNNLGYDILSTLPPKAVILLHGDSNTFNSWYVHYVLGVRPDVILLNNKGAGNDYFQEKLYKDFLKKNPGSKLTREDILRIELPRILKDHPVFSTFHIDRYDPNLVLIPRGIFYEIVEKKNIPEKDEYLVSIQKNILKFHIPRRETLPLSEQNLITPDITKTYSNGFVNVGTFLSDYYHDSKLAKKFFQSAIYIDNNNSAAYTKLGVIQLILDKDCNSSIKNVKKGIELYPIYEPFYIALERVYLKCNTPKKVVNELDTRYQFLFRKKLEDSRNVPSTMPQQ